MNPWYNIKLYSSLDSPKTGSGDHENVYSGVSNNIEIYDPNGEIYDDCVKKAVHIRETLSHIPWHSSRNPMVFSDLSNSTNKFLNVTVDDYIKNARNSIQYTKTVNSTYG